MQYGLDKKYHSDVRDFQLECQARDLCSAYSPTDPGGLSSDSEKGDESKTGGGSDAELGMIWTGAYTFAFSNKPAMPDRGWLAGKSPIADLRLSTMQFAEQYGLGPGLRSSHSVFQFDPNTAAFSIAKSTRSAGSDLVVGVETVERRHLYSLNQHRMRIWIGPLYYHFEYSAFASSKQYEEMRRQYMSEAMQTKAHPTFCMPTPLQDTRTLGPWTLHRPLEKGGFGRVFLASNSRNEVVAVKVMERSLQTKRSVDHEISTLRELTKLANREDEECRLVRLRGEFNPAAGSATGAARIEEVGLVLHPMTPQTFDHLIDNRKAG